MKISNIDTESRISRDDILNEFIEKMGKEEESLVKKGLRESHEQHLALLTQIRNSCSIFRATAPEAWSNFEEGIVRLHGIAFVMDQRSPLDLGDLEQGAMVDSQQWVLQKAYLQGQLKLLDAITRTLNLDIVKVQEEFIRRVSEEQARQARELKKSFFKRLLTKFVKVLFPQAGSN